MDDTTTDPLDTVGPVDPPHTGLADAEDLDDGPRGWTVQRVLGVLVALVIIGFWVWAFSPWAPSEKADGVQDATFLAAARASCATMQSSLQALPMAKDSPTAADRAEVVDRSGPILATMIAELRTASAPLQGRDAELTAQWISDWETYASDRLAYAAALRLNAAAEFIVSRRGTGQITVTMDGFSRVNDLGSCLVPLDV